MNAKREIKNVLTLTAASLRNADRRLDCCGPADGGCVRSSVARRVSIQLRRVTPFAEHSESTSRAGTAGVRAPERHADRVPIESHGRLAVAGYRGHLYSRSRAGGHAPEHASAIPVLEREHDRDHAAQSDS